MSTIAEPRIRKPMSLVEDYLNAQRQPTAVEDFSQFHDERALAHDPADLAKYYRDLIPAMAPGDGQQLAFEVDLDACSGCKSCVTACHSLNGLAEEEIWRNVGLLQGGTAELPVIQHVTSACHHCVEPACATGCPVLAYEKDPVTGIVRHLDDQCIGCEYCILKCPYDVPKYNAERGIVRKCDLCHSRLAAGEAPACVQACPTHAIRIRVVDQQTIIDDCATGGFLPGAPEPDYTLPTTVYKTNRSLPRNMLPADYYVATPGHGHLPLVFMLVLTQMSVGTFAVEQVLQFSNTWSGSDVIAGIRPAHLIAGLLLGLAGLAASVLHLGRPLYAFRALLGLRTSWLSREILAFGMFATMAALYAGVAWLNRGQFQRASLPEVVIGIAAALTGLLAVFCSVMVYVDTRRPFWNATLTTTKFFATTVVLGIPTALLISLAATVWSSAISVGQMMSEFGRLLAGWLIVAVVAKLLFECLIFTTLRHRQHTPLKRTALLMTGDLGMTTIKRFFFGVVGGVLLPGILLAERSIASGDGFHPLFVTVAIALCLGLLLIGELLERFLFFKAVIAPKMPGSPAS